MAIILTCLSILLIFPFVYNADLTTLFIAACIDYAVLFFIAGFIDYVVVPTIRRLILRPLSSIYLTIAFVFRRLTRQLDDKTVVDEKTTAHENTTSDKKTTAHEESTTDENTPAHPVEMQRDCSYGTAAAEIWGCPGHRCG